MQSESARATTAAEARYRIDETELAAALRVKVHCAWAKERQRRATAFNIASGHARSFSPRRRSTTRIGDRKEFHDRKLAELILPGTPRALVDEVAGADLVVMIAISRRAMRTPPR